ncbi:hypothetical protein CWS35_08120 [Bradyrhizobium sp. SK17]|jgi:hypothetical protein|uniref:ATPase inhibitor subunit zeta n=1 Tax=Alphaproteobacteria TaxID=28211 RepID=UPI000B24FB76|nr:MULTISPECIES: ATPase inhibitor subunit zeta [Alphaproteobacteria]AUC94251.1 hypothetical protein CWS35_08120 [Bradyrhizobium sp. SK17]
MTIDVLSAAIKDTSASSGAPAWCIDVDTRDNVIARRNILAALWAGRLMGLSDVTITTYAVEVHLADCEVRGDMVVVEKLTRDLNDPGCRSQLKWCTRSCAPSIAKHSFRRTRLTDI